MSDASPVVYLVIIVLAMVMGYVIGHRNRRGK